MALHSLCPNVFGSRFGARTRTADEVFDESSDEDESERVPFFCFNLKNFRKSSEQLQLFSSALKNAILEDILKIQWHLIVTQWGDTIKCQ